MHILDMHYMSVNYTLLDKKIRFLVGIIFLNC